jgi:MYXO-CTERM domain-containing protein
MRTITTLMLALTLLLPALAAADELEAETAALSHLAVMGQTGAIAFPEAVTFEPRLVLDWAGGTRVRLEQRLLGIPVHAGGLVVSLDPDGQVVRVAGTPVDAVLLDVQPTIDPAAAEARSQGFIYLRYGGQGTIYPPRSERVVFVGQDGEARLAWRVDVSTADPPGNYQLLVDAFDGHFLDVQSTLVHARGNIYPTNPVASELAEVDIPRLDESVDGMEGDYAFVNSCLEIETGWSTNCTAKERFALPDQDGNYLFDPDPTAVEDPLAEVQMYYHLDLISDWFDSRYGFAHPEPIEGLVNFDYNNAFFGNADDDPASEVAFGQSALMDFAYDADVIYHEFGHSVFGSVAGQTGFLGADEYGLEWATGGINEGTADLFALILTGDPLMGEYAGSGFGSDAIRDLEEDRHCPTDLYGEVHDDGEVFGSFAWNVLDDPLFDADLSGDYFWGVVSGLPVNSNWMDVSDQLAATADDMLDVGALDQGQRDRLDELMASQGLDACGRVIRLDEGQEPSQLLVAVGFAGEGAEIPAGQQFSIDAPDNAYKIRFRVKDWRSSEANLAWVLYGRRGEHVFHEVQEMTTPFGPIDMPFPEDYDFRIEGEGDGFDLELTLDSDPPLEPGETYFFSVSSLVTGSLVEFYTAAEITVDGDVYIEEVEGDDDEAGDDDDNGGDGCQDCSSSVAAGPAPAGLLALLLGLVALRRRNQSAQ